jgi:hypothetical protein
MKCYLWILILVHFRDDVGKLKSCWCGIFHLSDHRYLAAGLYVFGADDLTILVHILAGGVRTADSLLDISFAREKPNWLALQNSHGALMNFGAPPLWDACCLLPGLL